MADILDKLQQIKVDLEIGVQGEKILDIVYYGTINLSKNDLDLENETKEELYLIKKEKDDKIEFEFHTNNGIIATVGEGNVITISESYKDKINSKEFFIQLQKVTPISLQKLEQIRKQDKSIKDDLENDNLEQNKEDSKEVEIDLNKKVTSDMTFVDLVPEIRQKGIKQVKVRRIDSTKFEFYGIDANGQEVAIESLKYTEGTNPSEQIVSVNENGTVNETQALTMVKIQNGNNQGYGNEGFTVVIGSYGIPEVNYYRRDASENAYTSIPVNTKNTNQKQVDYDVRQYATKQKNPRSRRQHTKGRRNAK